MRLPKLMIAPNGAHKTKKDHANIPLTLAEIIAEAKACYALGVGGLHLHLRNESGGHILDAGLYKEALSELAQKVPEMVVQITTEAVGVYSAAQQRDVVRKTGAQYISASIREMHVDTDIAVVQDFYAECADRQIIIQHILYNVDDFALLKKALPQQAFSSPDLQLLHVLGRYAGEVASKIDDLYPFVETQQHYGITPDWAVCAFGKAETQCLAAAHKLNGKMRVGFENSFWNSDGEVAQSNAERVMDLLRFLRG